MKGTGLLLLFAVTFCKGAVISHEECSTDSLIPHENCNQYYQCVHGSLIVRNCSSILYFNPEIQGCDWPANVDCDNDDDPNEEASSCSSGKVEGQFFAHENCNQYYRCVHGNLIEHTCHSGLVYNYETSQCDWPYNVDCKEVTQNPDETETPLTESEKPDIDVTPSPDNSNESTSNEKESVEENSKEEEKSEEDTNIDSSDSSSESDSSDDDSNEDSSNESDSNVQESNEVGSNEGTSNEDESSAEDSSKDDSDEDVSTEDDVNKVCAAENSEGVLIPHEDCSKFYICAGGKPVVVNCPAGLLFNADTEQCDWPKNVDCGKNRKLLKKLEIAVGVTVRGKKGFKA